MAFGVEFVDVHVDAFEVFRLTVQCILDGIAPIVIRLVLDVGSMLTAEIFPGVDHLH